MEKKMINPSDNYCFHFERVKKTKELDSRYKEYLEYVELKKAIFSVFITEDVGNFYTKNALAGVYTSIISGIYNSHELYWKRINDHCRDEHGVIDENKLNIINEYYVNYGHWFKHDVDFSLIVDEKIPFEIKENKHVFRLDVVWDKDKDCWYRIIDDGKNYIFYHYKREDKDDKKNCFMNHTALSIPCVLLFKGKGLILRTRSGDRFIGLHRRWDETVKMVNDLMNDKLLNRDQICKYQIIVPTHENNFYIENTANYIYGYAHITSMLINSKTVETLQYTDGFPIRNAIKEVIISPDSWIYDLEK